MARRAFCFGLFCIACLFTVNAQAAKSEPSSSIDKRPNIIFILADDLGYGDVGCFGQKQIKTPHLDQMASEGLRFTQAYAGAPVCAPSRCVLMTGMHQGHGRVRGNVEATTLPATLLAEDVTVASVLKDAGYKTGLIGKWGLGEPQKNAQGLPNRHGFDYFYGYLKQGHAHNYYPDYLWRNDSKVKLPNVISDDPALKHNVSSKRVEYSHDLFAEEALKFVREHKDQPFFLDMSFTIPHANDEAIGNGMEVPTLGEYEKTDWPAPQKGYAAMVSRMDGDIGRLFALLKELKIDDNTLVIFTSDNGPHQEGGFNPRFFDSNGPFRGFKGNVTDGGIHEPMIARWPGHVPVGKTTDSPVYFADMMPTFAKLAGAKAPSGIDGVNILPTLEGHDQPELSERFMYWEFDKDGVVAQSARFGKWKAVRDPKTEKIELYDLSSDVGEAHNVADQNADTLAKFTEYFRTARQDSPTWPMVVKSKPGAKSGAASAE